MTSLDVVIVSYECRELLARCLRSLREHAPAGPSTVYVVDNASRDGTPAMVRRDFPEVRLIANTANAGFARANNQALRAGTATYALVLNPDTRVTPGCLDHLLVLLEARPEIG